MDKSEIGRYSDAISLFVSIVNAIKSKKLKLTDDLDKLVLKAGADKIAYVDNRSKAKGIWDLTKILPKGSKLITKEQVYSDSGNFPDFILKSLKIKKGFSGGAILELKDSKGSSIASFNSTLPTKSKTLAEVDVINGSDFVSKIVKAVDKVDNEAYYKDYQRPCLYLIRSGKNTSEVKLSLVDGAFFETLPKAELLHFMFMKILKDHIRIHHLKIADEEITVFDKITKDLTDQTIIAQSQEIPNASIKPRLRIMSEANPEANPHGKYYKTLIKSDSINLILENNDVTSKLVNVLKGKNMTIEKFKHKRDGDFILFEYLVRK